MDIIISLTRSTNESFSLLWTVICFLGGLSLNWQLGTLPLRHILVPFWSILKCINFSKKIALCRLRWFKLNVSLCSIAHVPHTPCTPYPLWALLAMCPIPPVPTPPVPLCPCGSHCLCTLYPCTPLPPMSPLPIGPIADVTHTPCTPLPSLPMWPITHWGTGVMGHMGNGAHGAIVYRGIGYMGHG